jgi:HD-GYP domain-containing protein (c-di-GMP phosphodiesterase class II)
MKATGDPERVRLAELVAALSLGIDLGFGQPMQHVLRQCLIALRLAERLDMDVETRGTVYYTSLLVTVACHSDAHEQAKWFGDDIALKGDKYAYELGSMRAAAAGLRRIGAGNPPLHRFRVGLEFALYGHREVASMISEHAHRACLFADELGLPAPVSTALGAAYEQWDGKGWPGELSGDQVPIVARIAQLAEFVEVAHRVGGVDAAKALARRRAGGQFDPQLAALLADEADAILDDLDAIGTWDAVIAAEPSLAVLLGESEFDAALLAVANFIDLKSPYTLGHAPAVAELAAEAGRQYGLSDADVTTLRRAGLVHGFGRLGVSNSIWDRSGPLSAGDWERVRMYPYVTERMLHQSPSLSPLGALAIQHRERLDGSGYPRGLSGTAITRSARVLGAAEAYQTKREPRPHREALSADEAARALHAEARAGRLEPAAVDAVLRAAGHRVPRRPEAPRGLTGREVDVLRLLARGMSNKQIAQRLVITPKTASNHIEHIYAKINANSRASAAMFAMQHGLLPDEELATADRTSS